jgi:hypothetical protein
VRNRSPNCATDFKKYRGSGVQLVLGGKRVARI